MIKRLKNTGLKILKYKILLVLFLLFIASIQYYHTEIYHLDKNRPFSGKRIYNPYSDYKKNNLKANFHAHSNAHKNLTNGAQQANQVINHYKNNGYDIISLSDYNKINAEDENSEYINTYEHGLNFGKKHQLVINSEFVKYFDFPLFQNVHHKQQVIKKLKTGNSIIALAHPKLWNGYSKKDMQYLKGVELIEVKNHYWSCSKIWDDALSSGNLVWALSNDDCHDITKDYYTFVNWNRIGVEKNKKENVLAALRKGNHYAVSNKKHKEINFLDSCVLNGNTIEVYFTKSADKIVFIGDYGTTKKEVSKSMYASYTMKKEDSYIRIEAHTGSQEIYLNPLIRYHGEKLTRAAVPPVNIFLTVLYRIAVLIVNTIILSLIFIINGNINISLRKAKVIFKFPRFAFNNQTSVK